jgi:hypothetical protein
MMSRESRQKPTHSGGRQPPRHRRGGRGKAGTPVGAQRRRQKSEPWFAITAQRLSNDWLGYWIQRARASPFAPRRHYLIEDTAAPCKGWSSVNRKRPLSIQ